MPPCNECVREQGRSGSSEVVVVVARVERCRFHPEGHGDLLHDDIVDHSGKLSGVLHARLDRPAVEHDASGQPTIGGEQLREGHALGLPGIRIGRGHEFDGHLDVAQARSEPPFDPVDGVQDEVVERVGS